MITLKEFIDYCNDEKVFITEYGYSDVLFDGYAEDIPYYLLRSYVTHVSVIALSDGEPRLHILLGGNNE